MMPRSICIAVPMELPAQFGEIGVPLPLPQHVCIELHDGQIVATAVFDTLDRYAREDIQLEALLLPAVPYFTFREYMRERLPVAGMVGAPSFNGVRILLDPTRDDGDFVPVIAHDDAINVFAKRKAK